MAKIVINISDEEYEDFKKLKEYGYGTMFNSLVEKIANGVMLPKGHGRLIDANKFEVVMLQGKTEEFVEGVKWVLEQLDKTDTIIEADKEGKK